jgi:hypothetical protein
MITICFSDNFCGSEVEISGTPQELRDIRRLILNFIQTQDVRVCIPAAEIEPTSDNFCLKSLSILKTNGSIKISIFDNFLKVEGEPDNLESFADWFNFDDNTRSGYHHHFDYYEGNEWVDPNSIALIISIR